MAIWRVVTSRLKEEEFLPRWARWVRYVLFPLDSFFWWMSGNTGYSVETDTWLIYGVRWSDRALCHLAVADGGLFRVKRTGDVVTIERVSGES